MIILFSYYSTLVLLLSLLKVHLEKSQNFNSNKTSQFMEIRIACIEENIEFEIFWQISLSPESDETNKNPSRIVE